VQAVPKVTIIIPCYNAEAYIRRAVESAISQTYTNVEVIVVDDGSTDCSVAKVRELSASVIVLTGPNRGAAAARNRGLSHANGEWIQFLDADDMLHVRKLEICLSQCAPSNEILFVWAPHKNTDEFGEVPCGDQIENIRVSFSESALSADYAPWAAVFRKSFLDRVGKWDENLHRWIDLEYHARIAALRPRFLTLNMPLYHYRQHSSPRISDGNRTGSRHLHALSSLTKAHERLLAAKLPQKEVNEWLYPFYLHLGREAGRNGDISQFKSLLRSSAKLRAEIRFKTKIELAILSSHMLGVRQCSYLIDKILA
jgi:glycosyltransferase involved in cell wall biosynthesis